MDKDSTPSFKIQIGSYNKEDGIVTYNIRVLSVNDNSFHIVDRYRNMRSLWEEIRRDAPNPNRIPEFPPKKWFGGRSRDFLDARKSALEIFFNTLLESPDKNVYNHIMKYFKKLAKNREAKDAISSIEEFSAGGRSNPKDSEERKSPSPQNNQVQTPPIMEKRKDDVKRVPYKDVKSGISSKEYFESCNKIVENFNKKLIDLGYTGADAIQEIVNKGQTYVSHFKDSGINQKFKYNTKLLDIPQGSDENFDLLDDDEIEQNHEDVNEKLIDIVHNKSEQFYIKQYQNFTKLNKIVWTGK